MNAAPRYTSLRDYLRVLREQRLPIVLIAIVAAGIALLVSLRQEPSYEATSALSFQDPAQQLAPTGRGTAGGQTPPEQTPQARAQTIVDPAVVKAVKRGLDAPFSESRLQGAISTSLDAKSFLVRVTASWDDAEFAADLANAFAREAARKINGDTRDQFEAQKETVLDRLSDLGVTPADQTPRIPLIEQLTNLQFLSANAAPANVVEAAQPPGSPVSPKPVRNTGIGLLLGLVIGVLVGFVRDSLDRRLHGPREISNELDLPLLGHVRDEAMGRVVRTSANGHGEQDEDLESFRILRQNLEFFAVDSPSRLVVVTSALPQEGKSTVAASLAFASAAAGKSTLLIDCDLRRPALSERMSVAQSPGLTDYLARQAGPRDVLQPIDLPSESLASNGAQPPQARWEAVQPLVYISAGTYSPQPAELLQSARLRQFLEKVSKAYEAVIIDTSPLLPVADTLELLPHVDIVLVCVRSGQTTREQAVAARAALANFPERPMGLVVTGLTKRDSAEYGYYSYGYAYGAARPRRPDTSPRPAATTDRSVPDGGPGAAGEIPADPGGARAADRPPS